MSHLLGSALEGGNFFQQVAGVLVSTGHISYDRKGKIEEQMQNVSNESITPRNVNDKTKDARWAIMRCVDERECHPYQ